MPSKKCKECGEEFEDNGLDDMFCDDCAFNEDGDDEFEEE